MRERAEDRLSDSAALFDMGAEFAKLESEADGSVAGHRQITLFKGHKTTVAIFAFQSGGGMREHAAPGIVTIQVLRGALQIHVGGELHQVREHNVLVLPPGVRHDVTALEDSRMLLTVSLAPD